jgi:colicin import membrane protein
VFLLNPSHEEARSLEQTIYASRQEFLRREEEARRLQEEQQRKLEEIRLKLEEQERKDREEEEGRAIRNTKISEALRRAEEYVNSGAYDKAMAEMETVYAMDPGNAAAQEIEMKMLSAQKKKAEAKAVPQQRSSEGEAWKREEEQKEKIAAATRELLRQESMNTFRSMLKQAWVDGQPTKEERAMVEVVRRSLDVSDGDYTALEREVQLEAYTEALRSAWKAGIVSSDDVATRENLRAMFSISSEDHLTVEALLRRELSKDGGSP